MAKNTYLIVVDCCPGESGDVLAEDGRSIGGNADRFRWGDHCHSGSSSVVQVGFRSLTIHSDSTSVIARARLIGAGPGQAQAAHIHTWVSNLLTIGRTVNIVWVKGRSGVLGNEEVDKRVGKAAEEPNNNPNMSLAHLKLKVLDRFRLSKEKWHQDPAHHGTMEIPPPPPRSPVLIGPGTLSPAR